MDAISMVGMVERGRRPRIGSVWRFDDFKWAGNIEYEAFPDWGCGYFPPFTYPNALNWAFRKWPHAQVSTFGDSCESGPNVAGFSPMNPNQALVEMAWVANAYEKAMENARSIACVKV